MIVNDAGCAMNIGGACHRVGAKFRVRHIAEVMAEAAAEGEAGKMSRAAFAAGV